MLAPTVMVQGTASSAGKSLLVSALCRIFRQEGLSVAPFKSQNMALNSFVTPEGHEIGRAQAVQAEAAGIPPSVHMNPILLKPEGDQTSQVVVLGRPIGKMGAREYHEYKPELRETLAASLNTLRRTYDLVVIEGAGSPAEINLREHEIVNMHVAEVADAPVLLVGDIDRGGVFASLVGTVELLLPAERERVAGFVINKFRGDLSLLDSGLEFLEERTGIPVFGVVPHIPDLRIAEEDSVALERRVDRKGEAGEIEIAILRFPRISNYDDFDSLEHENGVVVRYVERPEDLIDADLVILPGSKSTLADLEWMRQAGFAAVLEERIGRGEPVLGVCGGCQMLGETIEDPEGVESASRLVSGLGVFPTRTVFGSHKRTAQVEARVAGTTFLTAGVSAQETLSAYEIHMGRMEGSEKGSAVFEIVSRNGESAPDLDGAWGASGAVVGTMLHGILENDSVRASLLGYLCERRGLKPAVNSSIPEHDSEYDRLAEVVRESLDLDALRRTIGLVPATDRS